MKRHDYVEVTKGLYKGLRGFIDALPTARQAYLLTQGGVYPKVRLSSLRLVPDEETQDATQPTLPF